MALTIDELNIQIASDSSKATRALTSLIKKLEKLKTTLAGTNVSNITITNSFNKTTNATNKATTAVNKYDNASKKSGNSTQKLSDKLAQNISKWRTLYGAFQNAANAMGAWFNESNEYIETLNLFNVTMGDASESASEFAENVSALMGIDIEEWMSYQGTFKQLTSGFGVASDSANVMSQNLTQLSYDMASFFNTDVETAFDKLSSAMAGQVKGLRDFGIDVTVASLQEYALAKGIDKTVRSMTQAEKSMLRYNYIMEKSINMQGDMARTIVTPANALRILNAQLTQMKRAFGNIISVLAVKVIPYVQAFVQLVTEAAQKLALFLGFEIKEIDYSGLGSGFADEMEEGVEDTSDSLKKLKKQLMGFDELNIISNPNTDSGSGSDDSSGGVLDMKPLEYNFLEGLETGKLDEIKEKLKDMLWYTGAFGAALLGWKISAAVLGLGPAFSTMVKALREGAPFMESFKPFLTVLGKVAGVAATVAGAILVIKSTIEGWDSGVDWQGLLEQFTGLGLVIGGLFLTFGTIGAGIGSIIGGIVTLLSSVKSAIVDGNESWSNTLSIVLGISAVAGGIALLVGNWIPLAIGGVVALVAVILIYIDDIWAAIKTAFNWIYENFIEGPATWVWEKVIQPIINYFEPIRQAFREVKEYAIQKFNEIKQGVANAVGPIIAKVQEIYLKIKEIFAALWKAFREYIWDPFAEWATGLYNKYVAPIVTAVTTVFSYLWGKFKEHIWDKIVGFFTTLKDKLIWIRDQAAVIFKNVGTFVVDFVSGMLKKVINAVLSGIEWTINGFIRMLNGAIDLINKIPGVNISRVSELYIPRLAEGGIVSEGQMFIAREAGPELVGSIGRKTAVANNDQIIDGIYNGVYRAMMAANNGKAGNVTVNATFEMDGEVVGRKVIKYHNGVVMQTGESPLLV